MTVEARALFVLLFWKVPAGHPVLDLLCLGGIGFAIYGPQFLVGVLVADQATKRAAASAVGLSGFFGYQSGAVSGWGLAHVVERSGWDGGFALIAACSAAAIVPFALCWGAGPVKEEEA
jgi:OPA family glycerol-3-phosphate transporter-like MFS transporter/OPA family sugar phosphate sensor protein UhpC-like MFS transporter